MVASQIDIHIVSPGVWARSILSQEYIVKHTHRNGTLSQDKYKRGIKNGIQQVAPASQCLLCAIICIPCTLRECAGMHIKIALWGLTSTV